MDLADSARSLQVVIVGLVGGVLASCQSSAPMDGMCDGRLHQASPDVVASADSPIVPRLGAKFGSVLSVVAELVAPERGKGSRALLLRVHEVQGARLARSVDLQWSYGGWFANAATTSAKGGFKMEAGKTYLLTGYEAGEFAGTPAGLEEIIGDEWGPPQSQRFHFRSVFRVVDGKPDE